MAAFDDLQSMSWEDQLKRNLVNVYQNFRSGAVRYKAELAAGRPVADIKAEMDADAAQYQLRLDWHRQADIAFASAVAASLTRMNLSRASYDTILNQLNNAVNQFAAANKNTATQITNVSNAILNSLQDLGSLWPQ